jgi:GNAT superfamily N-acetyltransferase
MEEYILVQRSPTVEEYHRLRAAVGWGNVNVQATEIGLRNSLFSVCVIHKDQVVGFGRVVGDGGVFFYIQDIVVLPQFQGKGLGKRIMNAIMAYLESHVHRGAFIGLMAAKGVDGFYEKFGFSARPSERYGPGMCRVWGE